MNEFYYLEEKVWLTPEQIQKRLEEGFEFKCNECHKEIGDHLKTLAEGIFCVNCFNRIIQNVWSGKYDN